MQQCQSLWLSVRSLKTLHFCIPLMSASMQIIRFFSLRAAFSPSDKLGLHLLKKYIITVQLKFPLRPHLKATTITATKQKKNSNPHGPKFLADCQHPAFPSHKSWYHCSYRVYLTVYVNSLVLSGVGFGAYCAVDFALVMDVLPNDREKAKDLAVWHQVSE